jgi:DNA gyrase subunit A
MVSRSGMTIRYNQDDVRPMGRNAAGVRGMKMKPGTRSSRATSPATTPRS